MKKLSCLIILISFSFALFAQSDLIVYKTFKEYENDKGDLYKGKYRLRNFKQSRVRSTVNFVNKAKKAPKKNRLIRVKCDEVWGFELNGQLFRISEDFYYVPMCVLNVGKLVYYEQGLSHLLAIGRGWDGKDGRAIECAINWGSASSVSKTINSPFITVRTKGTKDKKRKLVDFVKENSEYQSFFKCLNNDRNPAFANKELYRRL